MRLSGAAGAVKPTRQRAERVCLPATVAERPVALECSPDVGDRLLVQGRHEALVRAAFEKRAALARVEPVSEAKRPPVLSGRLTVRAEGRGPLGRGRRELEHRRAVTGCLGVMRQPRRVGTAFAGAPHCGENLPMQRYTAVRGDRVLDCQPCQLVTERHGPIHRTQHSRGEALVEMVDLRAQQLLEQPHLHVLRYDRQGVQHAPSRVAELRGASQDRVADRGRDVAPAGCQNLGDEERVAARTLVQRRRVDPLRGRQPADRLERQRLQREPPHPRLSAQVAEHGSQRIVRGEPVIAVGHDRQRVHGLGAPPQHHEHVERRLIGPVDVLQHDDRRALLLELLHERREAAGWLSAVLDHLAKSSAGRR
jgi:hypothetical protein